MGSVPHATRGCEAAAHDPRAPVAVEPHPHAVRCLHGPPARRPRHHGRAPGRRPHARGARRRRRRGQGGPGRDVRRRRPYARGAHARARRRGGVPRARAHRHPHARGVGDGHRRALRRGRAAARHHHGAHRQPRDRQRPGARRQLLVLLAGPSCVPALPGFEDAGATITPDDIREALGWEGVAGLGEMMNMPGVIQSDAATHEMIGAVLDARLPVTGHWSLHGWDDHRLHAYVAAGVDCDHETVLRSDALAKLRAGMWVQLREGSAWHDVEKLAPLLLEGGIDARHALLVTDDMHPETLATVGHLNHAVRTAIHCGLDPLLAIQMATVNAAEYIGRRHDIGSIAPGRCADVLFVEDLREMRPHLVLADGEAIGGETPPYEYPARARDTVRIARAPTVDDLRIAADGDRVQVRA